MFFVPAVPLRTGTSLINTLGNLGLLTNLKLCLDAGDLNSYSGSGQTWNDISGGGYNFNRGSGSGSDAADPTFNGTAGRQSSGEYFSYDGGDYFTLSQSNPSWVQTFHKTGAKFTIVEWCYSGNLSSANHFFGTVGDCFSTAGFYFGGSSNSPAGNVSLLIQNAAGAAVYSKSSTNVVPANAFGFLAASVDFSTGAVVFQLNATAESYAGQTLSSPSSGSAEATLQLGALASQTPDTSGVRTNCVAIWDSALTSVQLAALYNATKGKFGL